MLRYHKTFKILTILRSRDMYEKVIKDKDYK